MRAAGLLALALAIAATAPAGTAEKRSGYHDLGPQTRAMQDDDDANPAFLWVARGEALWRDRPARADGSGPAARSCQDCHGDAAAAMRGVAARQPAWDEAAGRLMNLEQRIDRCREERQGAPPLPAEGDDRLALAALVGLQSRGLPMAASGEGPAAPAAQLGRRLFHTRFGQFDLACAQCHHGAAGQRLAGSPIPQGHANGYPIYRLEWQGMGSFARRLRNCMTGIRAEPFPAGSDEALALELHLALRAAGLPVETPAVRP
ncbi:sulfur oxidation c-type cytochrome SoxA [Stella sp.]|uniref:sulfur oxidation c-type cytochrome SoxA n=1 Tax=Stella sp. TaxID=2912054 RepID=UPI0035B0159E